MIKNFLSYTYQSDINQSKFKEKPSRIVILSLSQSKIIPRLILFLNELRLSYNEYTILDQNFYQDLITDIPSIIILDHLPNHDFSMFVHQYQISLLIYLNNNCQNCISINYSQMLLENITYPTMDFSREELKPILHTTTSPFKIKQSNPLIKLLRFQDILPVFHHYNQCIGLQIHENNSGNTIIYVQNKITFKKISLLTISSEKEIYLSECLSHHWFIWPLMMDIIRYLTSNVYNYHGFNRYIQIDIDDIFLGGKTNDQLKFEDIQALIRSQKFIRNYVANFRYRLGFSGFYYNLSNDEGNRLLISKFCSLLRRRLI
jgi:hypothetical protein